MCTFAAMVVVARAAGLVAASGHARTWITQAHCDTPGLDPIRGSFDFRVVHGPGYSMSSIHAIAYPLPGPGGCVVPECATCWTTQGHGQTGRAVCGRSGEFSFFSRCR